MAATVTATDIDALKARLKATWMEGNYDYFSRFMESSAIEFLDRLRAVAGASLLDVACGSGQLGLAAARRGARVTGVDIATNAILAARGRAASEGLDARFDEGDAEELPYADSSFDVVASLFGAMFAPRPERVAAELLRVCRRGGTIAMGNWTREGFIGSMFKTFARFIAPPGMPAPVLWGDESVVRERFGAGVGELRLTRVRYRFDYPFAPAEVVEFFRSYYGPTARAFAALGEADRAALRADLVDLWVSHNQAVGEARTIVDAEYLEVVGRKDESMTNVVSRDPAVPSEPSRQRARALADRLEEGASALAAFASALTDGEWQTRVPKDGRKIGVIVHHVATVYPIEIELAQTLAAGKPVVGLTMDNVHEMNARHAKEYDGVTKEAALDLLRRNSAAAATAIRGLSDDELGRAAPVSLYHDAPLTCQFVLEDHAVRHSYHHLARIRGGLRP
jgi:SAM-dependent methyltransferase